MNANNNKTLFINILFIATLNGCASTSESIDDPWENWNRSTQTFNDDFDNAILKPLAKGYLFTTPEIVDVGISNFFSNIDDIGISINDLLQSKFTQAGMDFGRFIVNSTAGLGGFIDVATMIDLPKHNEDFAQTLGVWGVPAGPYLVLPFWGPSSPRGTAGLLGDAVLDPVNYTIFAGFSVSLIGSIADVVDTTDQRAGLITTITESFIDEAAIDRYDFIKNSYLQHREFLINDGEVVDDVLDPLQDFEGDAGHQLDLSSPLIND